MVTFQRDGSQVLPRSHFKLEFCDGSLVPALSPVQPLSPDMSIIFVGPYVSGGRKFYCSITVGVIVESTLVLTSDCDIRSQVADPQTLPLAPGL